jgi:hypothetical protein
MRYPNPCKCYPFFPDTCRSAQEPAESNATGDRTALDVTGETLLTAAASGGAVAAKLGSELTQRALVTPAKTVQELLSATQIFSLPSANKEPALVDSSPTTGNEMINAGSIYDSELSSDVDEAYLSFEQELDGSSSDPELDQSLESAVSSVRIDDLPNPGYGSPRCLG